MAEKELEVTSKEKVALDLMERIAEAEYEHNKEKRLKPDPRTYYLKLFNQCIRAAMSSADVPYIINNE